MTGPVTDDVMDIGGLTSTAAILVMRQLSEGFQEAPGAGIMGVQFENSVLFPWIAPYPRSAQCGDKPTGTIHYAFSTWLTAQFPEAPIFSLCFSAENNPGVAVFGGVNAAYVQTPFFYEPMLQEGVPYGNYIGATGISNNGLILNLTTTRFLIDTGTQNALMLNQEDIDMILALPCDQSNNTILYLSSGNELFVGNSLFGCDANSNTVMGPGLLSAGYNTKRGIIGLPVISGYYTTFSATEIGFSLNPLCNHTVGGTEAATASSSSEIAVPLVTSIISMAFLLGVVFWRC